VKLIEGEKAELPKRSTRQVKKTEAAKISKGALSDK
jgi:hypothetical protein